MRWYRIRRRWGLHGCISCRKVPTNGVTVFCASCHDSILRMAPMIVEVPEDHERYKSGQSIGGNPLSIRRSSSRTLSVASQFRQKWMHSAQCPEVRAVYKIVSTTASLTNYEQYLYVRLIVVSFLLRLTDAATAIESRPSTTLLHKTKRAETRDADGTGRRGSAISEIRE